MTPFRTAALAFALAACAAEVHTGRPPATIFADETSDGWSEMQRILVGHFRAETKEKRAIDVSYRLVSKGSALVETFTSASGNQTLTVYHRDGRALMLTHFCAQGNQARLKATVATRERIAFSFVDATNVAADQDVMRSLAIVFRDDGFDQETVYRDPTGTDALTTLHFTRVADAP